VTSGGLSWRHRLAVSPTTLDSATDRQCDEVKVNVKVKVTTCLNLRVILLYKAGDWRELMTLYVVSVDNFTHRAMNSNGISGKLVSTGHFYSAVTRSRVLLWNTTDLFSRPWWWWNDDVRHWYSSSSSYKAPLMIRLRLCVFKAAWQLLRAAACQPVRVTLSADRTAVVQVTALARATYRPVGSQL